MTILPVTDSLLPFLVAILHCELEERSFQFFLMLFDKLVGQHLLGVMSDLVDQSDDLHLGE